MKYGGRASWPRGKQYSPPSAASRFPAPNVRAARSRGSTPSSAARRSSDTLLLDAGHPVFSWTVARNSAADADVLSIASLGTLGRSGTERNKKSTGLTSTMRSWGAARGPPRDPRTRRITYRHHGSYEGTPKKPRRKSRRGFLSSECQGGIRTRDLGLMRQQASARRRSPATRAPPNPRFPAGSRMLVTIRLLPGLLPDDERPPPPRGGRGP